MALKPSNATSAQPGKPAAMQDETAAAPVDTASPAGEEWDTTDATPDSPVATTTGGPVATVDPNNKFASMEGQLGFGSFPQVKLDKDKFYVGDEGNLEAFLFHPIQSQSRWIYKHGKNDFFFSYDHPDKPNARASDGKLVKDKLNEWKADGKTTWEIREYQELYGHILDGEFADRMVVLSIPPASIARFRGIFVEISSFRKLNPDQVVLHINKGGLIKTRSGETFYPWNPKFHKSWAEFEAARDAAPAAEGVGSDE